MICSLDGLHILRKSHTFLRHDGSDTAARVALTQGSPCRMAFRRLERPPEAHAVQQAFGDCLRGGGHVARGAAAAGGWDGHSRRAGGDRRVDGRARGAGAGLCCPPAHRGPTGHRTRHRRPVGAVGEHGLGSREMGGASVPVAATKLWAAVARGAGTRAASAGADPTSCTCSKTHTLSTGAKAPLAHGGRRASPATIRVWPGSCSAPRARQAQPPRARWQGCFPATPAGRGHPRRPDREPEALASTRRAAPSPSRPTAGY